MKINQNLAICQNDNMIVFPDEGFNFLYHVVENIYTIKF